MTSSVEWLNGTPRADFAILTFDRSTTAQLRKNKFSILVQWSLISETRQQKSIIFLNSPIRKGCTNYDL